jgi:hypothetical protein
MGDATVCHVVARGPRRRCSPPYHRQRCRDVSPVVGLASEVGQWGPMGRRGHGSRSGLHVG